MSQDTPIDINTNLTEATGAMKPTDLIIKKAFSRPLSADERSCVEYWAKHPKLTPGALAGLFNQPVSWVDGLKERSDYKEVYGRACLAVKRDESKPIPELFNDEIRDSLRVLTEIRDNTGESATNRLKAVQMVFDHAPQAPARKSDSDKGNLIINIPYQQIETLKTAADEIGSDLFGLLEDQTEND